MPRLGGGWREGRGLYLEPPKWLCFPEDQGLGERGPSWFRPEREAVLGTLLQSMINSWGKYSNQRDFVKMKGP